jgi:hypothetical protein
LICVGVDRRVAEKEINVVAINFNHNSLMPVIAMDIIVSKKRRIKRLKSCKFYKES